MKSNTLDNRITFRLPPELVNELNQIVDANQSSKSKVMRSLVVAWLEQQREVTNA